MDWVSWQDVIEDELDEAAAEGRPPPSSEELMAKAGIPTSLEEVAQSVPALRDLLAKRKALEDKMGNLLGGAPARSGDDRFDRLFEAPIPEDPVRQTRRIQPLSLEPKPLRERIREERSDRARRERLQGTALERRQEHNQFEQMITRARESRVQDRVKERLKDRIQQRTAERFARVMPMEPSKPLTTTPKGKDKLSLDALDKDGRKPALGRSTSNKDGRTPSARASDTSKPKPRPIQQELRNLSRGPNRLTSPISLLMEGKEGVQRRIEREVLPVLKRRITGAADGKARLLVRSPEVPGTTRLDERRRKQREDDHQLTARERQQERLARIREDAERRKAEAEKVRSRAEDKKKDVEAQKKRVEKTRSDVDKLRKDADARRPNTKNTTKTARDLLREKRGR